MGAQLIGENPLGVEARLAGGFGEFTGRGWQRIAAACLLLAVAAPAQASWRDEWSSQLEYSRGEAEAAARRAAQRTEQELRNRQLPPELAPAFAATIRMTRDRARAAGVRPVPAKVIQALTPHFSTSVLHQARWRPPMHRPSMSSLLVSWYFREGAVTLHDVVLFSDERLAQDPGFWAHELTHVEQYQRYGVDGFARRYVKNWESLEAEARQKASRVRAALARTAGTAPRPPLR